MILMQTKAIFVDAYRELNARKLFWITMLLNLLAVILFASMGINDRGVTFLHWTFQIPFVNTNIIPKEVYYISTFTTWGVTIWLSWVTTILALISTAGMIPDLVSGGTIEPLLSKPIGRTRLFLTKYATALLFVAMQVGVFATGAFLVIGIRGGLWEPGVFLALPIVLAFFSFLYSICALIGLVTRSTIAALLLTLLLWSMIFVVNIGDAMMVSQREGAMLRVQDRQQAVEMQERFAKSRLEQLRADGEPITEEDGAALTPEPNDSLETINPTLALARQRLQEAQDSQRTWKTWAARVYALKTMLPKTQETIALLERNLISMDDLKEIMHRRGLDAPEPPEEDTPAFADPRVGPRVTEIMRKRSIGWILGTSFAFEGVMLLLASLIFARRDF